MPWPAGGCCACRGREEKECCCVRYDRVGGGRARRGREGDACASRDHTGSVPGSCGRAGGTHVRRGRAGGACSCRTSARDVAHILAVREVLVRAATRFEVLPGASATRKVIAAPTEERKEYIKCHLKGVQR